jgi:cellobiose phosphorylase
MTYKYEDTTYEIHVVVNNGVNSIELDGKVLDKDFINLENDKIKHSLIVKIGD